MTLPPYQSRFEARNESPSATENIGQAFLILRFALSGYLLSERTPLLPKTNGAEPISASSSAIRRPASTSGYELWWSGISKERDCGEKQSFSTWAGFLKKLARALAFRAIDEEQSAAIKTPDRSTFFVDSSLLGSQTNLDAARRSARSSSDVHQCEGEVPPATALHCLIDPDHSERFQQARVLQRAGINWLETELTNELHHSRFPTGIVAGNQHDGLDRIVRRLGHIAGTRRIERLEDKGARRPVRDLLAGRGVEAEDKLQAVGPHAQWNHAVDHDLTREAAETFDRRLGRGPGRCDHHDLGPFDGLGWRFDALLG